MKGAEEANRGKVRKEIGGKLNPGKLARPALLRGFRPFCEDFGGEKYTLPSLSMGKWNIFDKSLKYFLYEWKPILKIY